MNYVIIPSTHEMLCNDNRFRVRPWFGTENWCVKGYKTIGRALSSAKKFRQTLHNEGFVMSVHNERIHNTDEFEICANGLVCWNYNSATIESLVNDHKNGIQNDFPVTFTKVA